MHFGGACTAHADAQTYTQTVNAFRRGDFETVAKLIHTEVVWHFPGTSWVARSVHGRRAVVDYLQELLTRTHNSFFIEDVDISGSDHHVLAIQRFGATFEGRRESFDVTSVLRYCDGMQLERWFRPTELKAFDGFFGKFDEHAQRMPTVHTVRDWTTQSP